MGTPEVTFTLTSCNRLDLLEVTMDSFLKHNTYPIKEYIISEDDKTADLSKLKEKYSHLPITWLQNKGEKRGFLANNDFVHGNVLTPYFFHCEDDWFFYNQGFIEKSMAILERRPEILNVWIREDNDTNGHPIMEAIYGLYEGKKFVEYKYVIPGYQGCWHGFTTNPTLKRIKDKVSYSAIAKIGNQSIGPEARVSEYYLYAGYIAVILNEGHVKHIGDGRTTL